MMQDVKSYLGKVMQLYETMVVRHGVMLVGQTLTGKTTNARTLSQSLTSLHSRGVEAHCTLKTSSRSPTTLSTMPIIVISLRETSRGLGAAALLMSATADQHAQTSDGLRWIAPRNRRRSAMPVPCKMRAREEGHVFLFL